MKKGEIYEGYVERMEFPNKGIVVVDGEKAVVKNALPGQKVKFAINKKRNGKCEGRLLEVLEMSPLESEEGRCEHFGICGGCVSQSIPYEEQLKIKEQQVKTLLDGVCDDYEFEGIKASPVAEGYRNKMEFSFGDEYKDGPLALGMHRRGSFHDVVTVEGCRIVHKDFTDILRATKEYFGELNVGFYKKLRHVGYLRHLLVRRAVKTGEILVALVTSTQTELLPGEEDGILEAWKNRLLALELEGTFAGILHIKNDSLADVVQSDETVVLYGQEFFYEELLGLRFKISPFSFFQTNSLEAVEAARINAGLNGLNNCEFIAGDVLKVIDDLTDKPDIIILDPPRDGVHAKALDRIINFGVDRIVYISCKPTSLVRDLVVLQERGYRVEKACAVDMFPSTGNVETVVMLSHKKPDSVINVKVEFGEGEGKVPLDNIAKRAEAYKPKERVTYKMIKEYIEAKYGFKVHTAYIAEVKRELGLPMYDAPNAVEELKQPRKHPTAEKMEAIKDALKHFDIIQNNKVC